MFKCERTHRGHNCQALLARTGSDVGSAPMKNADKRVAPCLELCAALEENDDDEVPNRRL